MKVMRRFCFLLSCICFALAGHSQSKYEGDALFSLQGITEGSDAFRELLDSLGPFEIESYPGGLMKRYVSKESGVSLTLYNRERVNSPSKTFHLAEMELTLGSGAGYYMGLLPLDIFTIVTRKEQLTILQSKSDVEIVKKKSKNEYIAIEYTGYNNARLGNRTIKLGLSYIDDQLFMLLISH